MLLLLGVFRYFEVQENAKQVPPAAGFNAVKLHPEPRLLENEPANLQQFRAAEDQFLNGYRWADQHKGLVKIPIDRAIDMLVQKELPARAQSGPQSVSSSVTVPTGSGLGPKMQPPGGPLAEGQGK